MKTHLTRYASYGLALFLVVVLATMMAACKSSTPTPTPTPAKTPTPVATATPTPTPSPTATPKATPVGKPTMIDVSPAVPDILGIGVTLQFTAAGLYADGSNVDITSQVKWTSTDVSVATISSTGLVTGVGNGTTIIRCSLSGVFSEDVTLQVQGG